MWFDWDEKKAKTNAKKHGVTFEQAITAFDDPFALTASDDEHSEDELRYWLIGEAEPGILVVIYTEREGAVVRLISARKADAKEKQRYETLKIIPV